VYTAPVIADTITLGFTLGGTDAGAYETLPNTQWTLGQGQQKEEQGDREQR
jgi:hypothetical protein